MARPGRKDGGPEILAVTGASGALARAFLDRLSGAAVLAVEDAADPRLADATTVVHLGRAGEPLLRLPRLRRLVVCTAAEVYGVHADNPVPIPDGAALRSQEAPELAEHLAAERLAERARSKGLTVTLLRPAAVVGLDGEEGPLLRHLSAPRMLAVRGVEPLWQLCHLDDLLDVLELGAGAEQGGSFGVACEGALTQLEVERLAGRRRLEVPAALALSTAERLHRLGVTKASPRELDHLLGHLVLACDGLRAAGWTPRWTNEEALQAHLLAVSGRAGEARSTAYTAAGATVALLGTAVLLRQARRRRRV